MITIQRHAAIGDILMVTPIVQALLRRHEEVCLQVAPALHSKIHALLNSPVVHVVKEIQAANSIIDLNNAYELRPHLHPVEAYCEVSGIDVSETTMPFCNAQYDPDAEKFDALIHPTISWGNRTLPRLFWVSLVEALHSKGLNVACVAQNAGEVISDCDAVFLGLPLKGVTGLIGHRASVFIGGDSGPLHLAATTQTPIIGLFTIALAERRRPWGRNPDLFYGINSAADCVGCLHRAPAPCNFFDCEFTDSRKHQCLNGFSIPEIVEKVSEFLNKPD